MPEEKPDPKRRIVLANVEDLSRFVRGEREVRAYDTDKYLVALPRAKHGGKIEDGKSYFPLRVCYNSETGRISVPRFNEKDGAFTIVMMRYARNSGRSEDGKRWETRNYQLQLYDPCAEGRAAFGIALQYGGIRFNDPELQAGKIATIEIRTQPDSEPPKRSLSEILRAPIQVVAERVRGIDREARDEIANIWHGTCTLKNVPTYPDTFGAMLGDEIIVDSVIEFYVQEQRKNSPQTKTQREKRKPKGE